MRPFSKLRPYALTIGGMDPCGAAGIMADIKTFEENGVYGMAVCTALTWQNDITFSGIKWHSSHEIFSQLTILLNRFRFSSCKIGIINDFKMLKKLIFFLKAHNKKIQIIWDPVIKSTTGFIFHKKINESSIRQVCGKINLITPNLSEIKTFYPNQEINESALNLSKFCPVLLKSSEISPRFCNDTLFNRNKKFMIMGINLKNFSKRGTGCVLSSAIAANLAKGISLVESCIMAKQYVRTYMRSNKSLLGYHRMGMVHEN